LKSSKHTVYHPDVATRTIQAQLPLDHPGIAWVVVCGGKATTSRVQLRVVSVDSFVDNEISPRFRGTPTNDLHRRVEEISQHDQYNSARRRRRRTHGTTQNTGDLSQKTPIAICRPQPPSGGMWARHCTRQYNF